MLRCKFIVVTQRVNYSCHTHLIFSLLIAFYLCHLTNSATLSQLGFKKKKKSYTQLSPSIKLYFSNWFGSCLGHLGLIPGWRMEIRWQPERKESEALGHLTLCSQHTKSPWLTAHLGDGRKGRVWEGAWIRRIAGRCVCASSKLFETLASFEKITLLTWEQCIL